MMQERLLGKTLLIMSIVPALMTAGARGQSQSPSSSGQAPTPDAVSVSAATVPRGKSFDVTVQDSPVGAKNVTVFLDDRPLKTVPLQRGTYRALVPDSTTECPQQSNASATSRGGSGDTTACAVSLGLHKYSVAFDDQWFSGDAQINIVKEDQTPPVLTELHPEQVASKPGKGSLVLIGSNFLIHPATDNTIVAGGSVIPVTWDGCPEQRSGDEPTVSPSSGVHGKVESSTKIELCNLTLPLNLQLSFQLRQGTLKSNEMTLRVLPWWTSAIAFMSFGVVIAAIALVVFLASFLPEYRINKTTYGMFRILFLDSETNTYSLSKYQFYLWTGAAIFSYSYFALSRVFVQSGSLPDVPSSLPGIIAIGAGTAIGAQVVTSVRGSKGGGPELPSLGDFITSGGVAAPERVQMFVWTNLGVVAFCIATLHDPPWHILQLPPVGDGLMYLMGISSAGYLGGKLARKPGPMLNEISISPEGPDDPSQAVLGSGLPDRAPQPLVDLTQPVAAAQQVSRDVQSAISPLAAASSPGGFAAAQSSLQALRSAIAAAGTPGVNLLSSLADHAADADAGSQLAAAEFTRIFSASANDPQAGPARILAEQAQLCAAAAQDLASGVSQAIAAGQAAGSSQVSAGVGPAALRTIDLRGRNLSLDATFEINNQELPFRMLADDGGTKAPKMVAPEDDPNQVKLARELRLSIDPGALGPADSASYSKWFGSGVKSVKVTITNPDGQQSEISCNLPPGSQQSRN